MNNDGMIYLAANQGRAACKAYKPVSDNPYDWERELVLWKAWNQNWWDMKANLDNM